MYRTTAPLLIIFLMFSSCQCCISRLEVHEDAPDCQNTCENPEMRWNLTCLTQSKTKGCRCRNGYLRHPNGKCVPWKECGECGENASLAKENCFSQAKCYQSDFYYEYNACSMDSGCVCDENYARDPEGKCIPEDQCPKCQAEGEMYVLTKTCESPKCHGERSSNCTQRLRFECRCEYSRAKNDSGSCVELCDGPVECDTEANRTLTNQGNDGQLHCWNKDIYMPWTYTPGRPVCECFEGYVLNSTKACIDKADCPAVKPRNGTKKH